MSHEFYQIMVGAPSMSLYSWKQLARWSIEYSCLSTAEQQQGYVILEKAWKDFSALVVQKCESIMKGDEVDEGVQPETFERVRKSFWG
jgi:adenosine deaminase CECR1